MNKKTKIGKTIMAANTNLEKHSVKIGIAALVAVIIFMITFTAQVASWKSTMEAEHKKLDERINHVGEKVVDMQINIDSLEQQATGRDIQLATINTKLANIESLLLEIKQDLKETD